MYWPPTYLIMGIFTLVGLQRSVLAETPLSGKTEASFDSPIVDGVESLYTERLINIAKAWKVKFEVRSLASANSSTAIMGAVTGEVDTKPNLDASPSLKCYSTPGSKSYVGIRSEMTVDASVAKVDEVVGGINDYSELFPGYKKIQIVSKNENRWLTHWEQIIPVFFIANLRYDITYLVDHSTAGPLYRSELMKNGSLRNFDGLTFLERVGPNVTRYTQYTFFDADYGMLEKLAPSKIWTGSIEAVYLSDMGLKYRAEHPDWTFETIRDRAKKGLKTLPIDEIADARAPML